MTQFLALEVFELLSTTTQEIEFSTSERVWRTWQVPRGPLYGWMGLLGGSLCQLLAAQVPGLDMQVSELQHLLPCLIGSGGYPTLS